MRGARASFRLGAAPGQPEREPPHPFAGAGEGVVGAASPSRSGGVRPPLGHLAAAARDRAPAGTTDENIQWAACKWGLSDNLLRAIAIRESNWYQYEIYSDGTCVLEHGCGDLVTRATPATRSYCRALARSGVDYQQDLGPGRCPKTFSIVGVMSWHDPDWGDMPDNQNGTFPFNRDSTAFALDYLGAFLRGCQEGWVSWLGNEGAAYKPGMIWDCVAVWYAGEWRTKAAEKYEGLVRAAMRDRPWLDPEWANSEPACADAGCPHGAT